MQKPRAADDDPRPVANRRARLIDHNLTAIDHLFKEPQKGGLVVVQADLAVFGADVIDAHGAA